LHNPLYSEIAFTHKQDKALLESNLSGLWGFAKVKGAVDYAAPSFVVSLLENQSEKLRGSGISVQLR